MRSPWAREYARTPNRDVWGTEASELAHQVSALLPPGARVLDLGCGEGRDSVFFAQRGFERHRH
jgi:cyclopropane fatty-acyl-phospholipid synthase-like methyltransferase